MTSARIPRPPRFLVRLVLVAAPPVMVMCVIIGVLALGRSEYFTALRFLALAGGQAGGWMYALRMHRRERRG